jgi:L-iditol 2-dehydrogenase
VLVRVHACGVCGSDIHGYDGSSGRRIPPLVMGHEAAGIVERTGAAVSSLSRGERVTWDSTVSCGACDYCREGRINLCDRRMVLGVSCRDYRRDGAFAEYVALPARICYPLPPSLPFEHAALIEALSVAVHAVRRASEIAPLSGTATALVVGCGTIGLLTIQALRAHGCANIIASEIQEERRALAARVGATAVVDPARVNLTAEVKKSTGGAGADHAFEAVGLPETVRACVDGVRKGGTVTLIGNVTPEVGLPLQDVVTRELSLLGTCASAGEYPHCIALLASGVVDVGPLITAMAPLEEGPSWFGRLHRGEPGLMKVILRP